MIIPRTVRLMLAASLAVLPYFVEIAEKKRGYFAFGGEFLILLSPFILWMLWINVRDTILFFKSGYFYEDSEKTIKTIGTARTVGIVGNKSKINILDPDEKEAARSKRSKSEMNEKLRRSANV
ncbi:MAG: hypothetical protein LBK29_04295 [Oscillospiraceae bacterium]|jgi:hypothetical protein|nr:hypothetical protein [Oscillospiraceae bacterium]